MKKPLLLLLGLLMVSPAWALPHTVTQEVDHDPLGVWKRSRSFERMRSEGVRTVFMPERRSFFAYWTPAGKDSGRVMVAVHGTGGNPYEELKDELPMAKKYGYTVVAVNWFTPQRGFYPAKDVYQDILYALDHVQRQTGNDLRSVAYIGFSRGSAISYEVAYLDARSQKLFDLIIGHSGGIPRDFRIELKDAGSEPDVFFKDLAQGDLGPEPMKGAHFFLYSGDKDESWGTTMSDQMSYAKELIEKNGGEVVEWVRRADLGHSGFRQDRSINEKALKYFFDRTSS